MCGRVTVRVTGEDFQREFNLALKEQLQVRFNLAPTQPIPAVLGGDPERTLSTLRWGLVPSWAKDLKVGSSMINARAETLSEKPAFKQALERRRCIVLVDGFYEWRKDAKARFPFHIQRAGAKPMAFAGLWDEWASAQGERVRSCTVITTAPNALMAQLHDRMPLILTREEVDRWLEPGALAATTLAELLRTSRIGDLELKPVASRVNKVDYDAPDCLEEVAPPPVTGDLFAGAGSGVAPRV